MCGEQLFLSDLFPDRQSLAKLRQCCGLKEKKKDSHSRGPEQLSSSSRAALEQLSSSSPRSALAPANFGVLILLRTLVYFENVSKTPPGMLVEFVGWSGSGKAVVRPVGQVDARNIHLDISQLMKCCPGDFLQVDLRNISVEVFLFLRVNFGFPRGKSRVSIFNRHFVRALIMSLFKRVRGFRCLGFFPDEQLFPRRTIISVYGRRSCW